MKLSNRKRKEIAAVIHDLLTVTRIQIQCEFGQTPRTTVSLVDLYVAQLEIPLVQAVRKIVEGEKST